jgi:hypothetical protein
MGGCIKTSTPDVTIRAPLSPYLRLKMEIALVASPRLSGNQLMVEISFMMIIIVKIVIPSCLTLLALANSFP